MKKWVIFMLSLVLLFSGCNVTQNSENIKENETQMETRSSSSYPGCHRYGTVYNVIEDSVTRKVSPACTRCTREEYHSARVHSATLLWKCVEPGCNTRYTTQAEGNDICSDLPDDGFHEETYPAIWLNCNTVGCTRYGLTHDVRVLVGARQSRTVFYASGNCRRCYRTGDHKIRFHDMQNITKCSAYLGMRLTTARRFYDRCLDE